MSKIAISTAAKRKIEKIFEHPGEVYSIYRAAGGETEWAQGKVELYDRIRKIEKEP